MDKKVFIVPDYNKNKKLEEPESYVYDVIKKGFKKRQTV